MEYYAIQVWTGKEDALVKLITKKIDDSESSSVKFIVPKRTLSIRKLGKVHKEEKPIFPGYIFLAITDCEIDKALMWKIRSTNFFVRFLPTSSNPVPIRDADKQLLAHFMTSEKTTDISNIRFDENDRIIVLDGLLKGLEGNIIKVNKRKGRVKVQLNMCENSFVVDFAFIDIGKSEEGKKTNNDVSI